MAMIKAPGTINGSGSDRLAAVPLLHHVGTRAKRSAGMHTVNGLPTGQVTRCLLLFTEHGTHQYGAPRENSSHFQSDACRGPSSAVDPGRPVAAYPTTFFLNSNLF
jgi:hypothetical protein